MAEVIGPIFGLIAILFFIWSVLYLISFVTLWAMFKSNFREYEMDFKSMSAISAKTFAAFLIINIFSFFVARRLFVRSGMEKKDASKISMLWIAMTISVIIMIVIARLMAAPW